MIGYIAFFVMLFAAGMNSLAAPGPLATSAVRADTTVVLSVTVGDRAPATLVVVAGSTATITMANGSTLGLTATLSDAQMTLRVRELSSESRVGTEGVQEFTIALQPGGTARFDYADSVFKIRWSGSAEPGPAVAPDQECGNCCITCDEIRYCACKVITVCADCCCPQCCNIIGKPGALPAGHASGGSCRPTPSVKAGRAN